MSEKEKKFRTVNPSLGTAPKVGPFPADQVVPWTAIFLTSYYVGKVIFGLDWLWVCLMAGWGIATWWVLTGSKSWRFLSKFVSTPAWTRGYARYQRLATANTDFSKKQSKKKKRG